MLGIVQIKRSVFLISFLFLFLPLFRSIASFLFPRAFVTCRRDTRKVQGRSCRLRLRCTAGLFHIHSAPRLRPLWTFSIWLQCKRAILVPKSFAATSAPKAPNCAAGRVRLSLCVYSRADPTASLRPSLFATTKHWGE